MKGGHAVKGDPVSLLPFRGNNMNDGPSGNNSKYDSNVAANHPLEDSNDQFDAILREMLTKERRRK